MTEYKSLFNYLGKPAGGELGKKVATEASLRGLKLEKEEVDKNLVPSGFVYSYPVDFLDDYFHKVFSGENKKHNPLEDRIKALEERVLFLEEKYLKNDQLEDELPF